MSTARRTLYPITEPYKSGMLDVGDGHSVYYECVGNPAGKPAVFVHGGPGGGTCPEMRGFFDPAKYNVTLFDQRGCGKSLPFACLENNTTWHLVADMEKLRAHLGISKWLVFGGSWGSTLGLAYAQTHPEAVTELVLRGIFALRKKELDWFYEDVNGASMIYPDAWEAYLAPIPVEERGALMAAYYKRLTGSDEAVKLAAAKAWSVWEGSCSKLIPNKSFISEFDEDESALQMARIECHYFVGKPTSGFFEREGQLLEKASIDRIRHIPTVIVQGRYDIVCPIATAWDLHKAFPEAEFNIIPDAGHSAFEPAITAGLVEATDKFAQ